MDEQYQMGYDDGYAEGKQQEAQDSYDEGYDTGYSDAKTEYEHSAYENGYAAGYEDGKNEAYEEGYADGERMLYSIDNPLEVITDLEHEVNLVLTHPESYSPVECLELVQKQCQKMMKDWGQFVG